MRSSPALLFASPCSAAPFQLQKQGLYEEAAAVGNRVGDGKTTPKSAVWVLDQLDPMGRSAGKILVDGCMNTRNLAGNPGFVIFPVDHRK